MKVVSSFSKVYLYRKPVDFRKSINGLGAIIQEEMKLDIYSKNLIFLSEKNELRYYTGINLVLISGIKNVRKIYFRGKKIMMMKF